MAVFQRTPGKTACQVSSIEVNSGPTFLPLFRLWNENRVTKPRERCLSYNFSTLFLCSVLLISIHAVCMIERYSSNFKSDPLPLLNTRHLIHGFVVIELFA